MGDSLQDRIVLVTGGSTGVGLGTAKVSCPTDQTE
jgi:NAD(P)-dependent dehydrogenase (short-subunit alcohol dehydrogenase family)